MRTHGQALAETLIGMLVLVPLFLLIAYLGKFLTIKDATLQAQRYVVWERTIFSSAGEWDAGENRKSNTRLAEEIDNRFLGETDALLDTDRTAFNPLWSDHNGNALVNETATLNATLDEAPYDFGLAGTSIPFKPSGLSLVTALAHDGLPLLNELDTISDLAGGALDFNLGLNDSGFANAQVSISATALPLFERTGVINAALRSNDLLTFSASGAILTDAWVPGSEANYQDRLDGLVIDEIVSLLVAPGTFTFGFFPLFKEGLDGQSPKLESESKVIPPRYVRPEAQP